jgi:hypothetical protein
MSTEHESAPSDALGPSSLQTHEELAAVTQGASLHFVNHLDVGHTAPENQWRSII